MGEPIQKLRKALSTMHARACGDTSKVYMSVPVRPDVDADMLLSGALDELDSLRAQLSAAREALRHARSIILSPAEDIDEADIEWAFGCLDASDYCPRCRTTPCSGC